MRTSTTVLLATGLLLVARDGAADRKRTFKNLPVLHEPHAEVGRKEISVEFGLQPGHAQEFTQLRVLRRSAPKGSFAPVEVTGTFSFRENGMPVLLGGTPEASTGKDGTLDLVLAAGFTEGVDTARLELTVGTELASSDEVCISVRTEDGQSHLLTAEASVVMMQMIGGDTTSFDPDQALSPDVRAKVAAAKAAAVQKRNAACAAAVAKLTKRAKPPKPAPARRIEPPKPFGRFP